MFRILMAVFTVLVLLGTFAVSGATAANRVPGSAASGRTLPLDANALLPPACAFMDITNLVTVMDEAAGAYLGTSGNDLIFGTPGNDVVMAGDGDDCIVTGGGEDAIMGEGGDDVILAGDGLNVIDGGDGTDTCTSAGAPGETMMNCE